MRAPPLDEAAILLVAIGLNPRHAKIRRLGFVGSEKQSIEKEKVNNIRELCLRTLLTLIKNKRKKKFLKQLLKLIHRANKKPKRKSLAGMRTFHEKHLRKAENLFN